MNNGVIILSYCEIGELHLLFLPLKAWLPRCSSALCAADPHPSCATGWRDHSPLRPMKKCFFWFCFIFSPSLVGRTRHRGSLQRAAQQTEEPNSPALHRTSGAGGDTAQVKSGGTSPCPAAPFPPASPKSSSLDRMCSFLSKRFLFISFSSCRKQNLWKHLRQKAIISLESEIFLLFAKIRFSLCCEVCCAPNFFF